MTSFFKKYRILFIGIIFIAFFFILRSRTKSGDFSSFCDEFFIDELSSDTLNLHFTLSDPASFGINDYDVTLGTISADSPDITARSLNRLISSLEEFSSDSMDESEKQTYDILLDYVKRQQDLSNYPYYEEILTPSGGITSELPVLLAEYSFHTKQDVDDYLLLLSGIDEYFSGVLNYEKAKAKAGLFMSDKSCNKVLAGCEVFAENPTSNILTDTFESRLSELDSLTEDERAKYIAANEDAISEHVIPAYREMIEGLSELLGSGQNDWGLCNYPDGKDYYAALVAANTGCDDEVGELFSEIEEARDEDLSVCAALLSKNPSLAADSAKLPDSLTDENAMLETLENTMLSEFPESSEISWEITHVDPTLSDYLAPAFYITAPIDDYSTNSIYINDANEASDLYYFTTLAHEGFPGHLYQTVFSYDSGLPAVRSLINYPGYTEGWATYAEMLSYYYAGLDDDLASLLQHNQAATLSLYATSDIGIHYYGWEKDEITAFWEKYGITDETTIDAITELILEQPANYLKYYVGYLKFRKLREKEEGLLGDNFDLTAFHCTILSYGPAPFSLLESYVQSQN
jgi:uncharacterized protein (DUF885 family)